MCFLGSGEVRGEREKRDSSLKCNFLPMYNHHICIHYIYMSFTILTSQKGEFLA